MLLIINIIDCDIIL